MHGLRNHCKLDPVYGLYAGIAAGFTGSLIGSSSRMITGPTGTLCLVVGGIIYGINTNNPVAVAMTLALMVVLRRTCI